MTLRTRARQIVDRRTVLAGAGGAALATLGIGSARAEGEAPKTAAADPAAFPPTAQFKEAFAKIIADDVAKWKKVAQANHISAD